MNEEIRSSHDSLHSASRAPASPPEWTRTFSPDTAGARPAPAPEHGTSRSFDPGSATPGPRPPEKPVTMPRPAGPQARGRARPQAGVHRHRGADVSLLLAGGIGVVLTVLFYGAVFVIHKKTHYGSLFLERGFIPPVIVFMTSWVIGILFLKVWKIAAQRAELKTNVLPAAISPTITPENAHLFMQHIRSLLRGRPGGFLTNRVLNALAHFRRRRNVQEVAGLLNAEAEMDAAVVESSYSIAKVFIWAIPILGFVGTVLGIGLAVGGFSETIQGTQEMEAIKTQLGAVTTGLAVAFDTTLIALLATLFIMLPQSSLQKREEDILSAVDAYCHESLLRRLDDGGDAHTAEAAARQVVGALDEHHMAFSDWKSAMAEVSHRVVGEIAETGRDAQNELLEKLAAVREEHATRLERHVNRLDARAHEIQDRIDAAQEQQVARFQDVVRGMAIELRADRQESLEARQAELGTLERTAERVAETLRSVQEQAASLPERVADGLTTAMAALRSEVGRMAGASGDFFRQQAQPLADLQQSVEASARRFAEHIEAVRPVHAQSVAAIQEALQRSVQELEERLDARVGGPVQQLQEMADGLARRFEATGQVAEAQTALFHKAAVRLVQELAAGHERIGEQVAVFSRLLESQPDLARVTENLNGTLEALHTTGDFRKTLMTVARTTYHLTPVLKELGTQVDRLAGSGNTNGRKRRWLCRA